jgi:hypothetical protein
MAELIALIVLGISLCGALFIVGRNIPALLELQNNPPETFSGRWSIFLGRAEILLKKIPFLKQFSWQAVVEKNLSKARVLALKADNRITGYLTALHVWEEEKKNGFAGSGAKTGEYWTDVKKFVQTKTGLKIKPLSPKPETDNESVNAGASQVEPLNGGNIQAASEARPGAEPNKKNKKHSHKKSRSW